jgi:flavin reductase (DIM6/NTAB) family NADH-FMN oxidoreductase RutF
MPAGQFPACEGGRYTVQVTKDDKVSATVKISLVRAIEDNNRIIIYRIEKVRCYNQDRCRQFILIKYFFPKGKKTFREGMIYGALYSYPRSIITVSYKEEGYYNIFPMDFQGCFEEEKLHIFGLRITNITLEKILHAKRIVIGDTGASDTCTIYGLGSHHSSNPPQIDQLPFPVIESEQFKFPVPAFTGAYKEIEVISSYRLGSHMMLVGKVVNEKRLKEPAPPLYHIHFFQFIQSGYITV